MIISDLYKTKIECDNTKLSWGIDSSTGNVCSLVNNITVTLSDFNNNPVIGKTVTVTCLYGLLSTDSGDVHKKKVTSTTNNQGKITIYYDTFSPGVYDRITCNETSILVDGHDTGWIDLKADTDAYTKFNNYASSSTDYPQLSVRRIGDVCELRGFMKATAKITAPAGEVMFKLPLNMAPSRGIYSIQQSTNANKYLLYLRNDGECSMARYNDSTSTSQDVASGAWVTVYQQYTASTLIPYMNDLRWYLLDDSDIPSAFPQTHTHSVSYNSSTGTTLSLGSDTANNVQYYMVMPFTAEGDFEVTCTFTTSGFDNDDFGIRICDKQALDNNGTWKSYGAWLITGQNRVAFGYGTGLMANNTFYYDSGISNSLLSNDTGFTLTMALYASSVYFKLTATNGTVLKDTGIITRTDTYKKGSTNEFSGDYYLYIGGGKFSWGANSKSVNITNLIVKKI